MAFENCFTLLSVLWIHVILSVNCWYYFCRLVSSISCELYLGKVSRYCFYTMGPLLSKYLSVFEFLEPIYSWLSPCYSSCSQLCVKEKWQMMVMVMWIMLYFETIYVIEGKRETHFMIVSDQRCPRTPAAVEEFQVLLTD